MKKNISINLQGLIFHIEEDGYDVLSRYLAEVRAHFSGYRGHEEIVADIEARIAELFAARTSTTKQVITLADVQEMVGKMGRVSDFQTADEAEEEEEALAGGPEVYTNYAKAAGAATAEAATEPKRLFRDMANRKIAGVAAGIARYFAINPLWVRLGFLTLLLLPPVVFDRYDGHSDFGGDLAGVSLLVYIILWIALPKRYDMVAGEEDPTFKKLYRDTDTGKVGGVSAGLAAYFNVDVVLIRVLFVAFLFAGGFAIPLYIALWILLPEAKTVSDRMRMRGDALTLSSLDSNLRSNPDGNPETLGNNRPVGTFLEELFRNIRPLLNFIGSALRIFIGVMMTIIGFGFLLTLLILLGIGLGTIPESQNFVLGDVSANVMMNTVPSWALLAFFLLTAIPALAMMLAGLGLLLRRSILSRTANLTMFGLWLLGVVGVAVAMTQINRNFQEQGEVTQTQRFTGFEATPTLLLDTRRVDRGSDQRVDVRLAPADSGAAVEVEKTFSASGYSEAEARQTAVSTVTYTVRQSNDSTLLFDDHFSFRPSAKYRDQDLSLLVRLPRNKTFRLGHDFSYMLNDDNFVNDQKPNDPEKHTYRLRGNQLECLSCTGDDLEDSFGRYDEDDDQADSDTTDTTVRVDAGDESYRIRVNTDDDEDGNVGVDIDIDDKGFSTAPGRYGSGRRTFNVSGFRTIEASGAYRVLVRQGPEFKVDAAGDDKDLRDLRVEANGNELTIRGRNRNSFLSGFGNRKPVLIRVQMPELTSLDLSGVCKANVAGFKDQALQVEQSGACYALLNVDVPRLDLNLSGACRTDLRGAANELNVEGDGASQVQGLRMSTQSADLELSGMSKARVKVADRLRAELSGASRVEYTGSPNKVQKDVSGSSRVVRLTTGNSDDDTTNE
ncbi:PspC domain-containing protein [Hymenobacter aquaticus]|uniref:PspC domain-containing protein n=1 Tax=Hymenobacter aquaticus TaxID=1867101 RepID=A0A4Z0Q2X1_9BACT|nr:PspC domain-containing protein [Hymenobacter aquaticus]TGE23836.1 PspC domain-containing protein [Hymenobacter aquaticus]